MSRPSSKRLSLGAVPLAIALASGLGGCAEEPICHVSAGGIPNPVMFGPIERVGDDKPTVHPYAYKAAGLFGDDIPATLYEKRETQDEVYEGRLTVTDTKQSAGIRVGRSLVQAMVPEFVDTRTVDRYRSTDLLLLPKIELRTSTDTNRDIGHQDETIEFGFHAREARFVHLNPSEDDPGPKASSEEAR